MKYWSSPWGEYTGLKTRPYTIGPGLKTRLQTVVRALGIVGAGLS